MLRADHKITEQVGNIRKVRNKGIAGYSLEQLKNKKYKSTANKEEVDTDEEEIDTERINKTIMNLNSGNMNSLRTKDLNYVLKISMKEEKYSTYGEQVLMAIMIKQGILRKISPDTINVVSSIFKHFKEGKRKITLSKTRRGRVKMVWNGKVIGIRDVKE